MAGHYMTFRTYEVEEELLGGRVCIDMTKVTIFSEYKKGVTNVTVDGDFLTLGCDFKDFAAFIYKLNSVEGILLNIEDTRKN